MTIAVELQGVLLYIGPGALVTLCAIAAERGRRRRRAAARAAARRRQASIEDELHRSSDGDAL